MVAVIAVAVGVGFIAVSLLVGMSLTDGFLFGVGVTVALVPEGLLPTVTLSLAMGAGRMAENHALVRRLEAVETLGSTTFICTDKTGTLTCNQMSIVSVWTPLQHAEIAARWFSWPNIALLAPVPVATALAAFGTWRALDGKSEAGAFIGAAILFTLSYIGIAISLWPMIVPYHSPLWETASSPKTQAFLLIGTLFLLPVILVYTGWSYWVFRGKVRADMGYH
jgi:cytochrome bd-type quinol oxidase subunit 2